MPYLVNTVVAKVGIIDNHAATITLFILSLAELTATNKRLAIQLSEGLGQTKDYS